MWIVEAVIVGAVVWAMMAAPQLLDYSLSDGCKKLFLAVSFALSIGFALLANGLKFYGIIPIGGK